MPEQQPLSNSPTLPPATVVDGPGVYSIPEADYHARPELSSTGIRKLLPPSCPALFKHWRDNGDPPKRAWEVGSAAHKLVLGVGPKLVRIDAEEWRSNAVKAEVAAVRDAGSVPLRPSDWDVVHAMADALRAHPFAGKLFEPGTGRAEQTLIWQESATYMPEGREVVGRAVPVRCRALVDWLPNPRAGRMVVPDFKSAASAAPAKIERTMADFGYHVQLCLYLRGLRALGLAGDDAQGLLVVQEKTAPYLVTVVQPDRDAMRLAEMRIREALDIYAEATATGRWKGYSDDVVLASLPPWELKELEGQVW